MSTTTERLLLLTGGRYHDFAAGTAFLDSLFRTTGNFAVEATQNLGALRSLDDFDVVVMYTHGEVLPGREEQSLVDFVAGGGGLLGIHSASASFYPNRRYRALLGCRFLEHAPVVHTFRVSVSNPGHPLAAGMTDFDVTCELYHCECDAGLDVFLTADWKGTPTPIAYTKAHGAGRVCYVAVGHDERALENRTVADLLVRASRWVGAYDSTV